MRAEDGAVRQGPPGDHLPRLTHNRQHPANVAAEARARRQQAILGAVQPDGRAGVYGLGHDAEGARAGDARAEHVAPGEEANARGPARGFGHEGPAPRARHHEDPKVQDVEPDVREQRVHGGPPVIRHSKRVHVQQLRLNKRTQLSPLDHDQPIVILRACLAGSRSEVHGRGLAQRENDAQPALVQFGALLARRDAQKHLHLGGTALRRRPGLRDLRVDLGVREGAGPWLALQVCQELA
mmetsp:Transcript_36859/g.102286  ORF Transcript_36859/g.102286 Transcript_36859/m.102286 type:complete len:239 (+) Transcript_36859:1050-1766(+)